MCLDNLTVIFLFGLISKLDVIDAANKMQEVQNNKMQYGYKSVTTNDNIDTILISFDELNMLLRFIRYRRL